MRQLLWKVLCFTRCRQGGTGKDVGKHPQPFVRVPWFQPMLKVMEALLRLERILRSVTKQLWICADVPEDITVVGVPAKVVRVHIKRTKKLSTILKVI